MYNTYSPSKARVGKLYELRYTAWELDIEPPRLFTYNTHGNFTNRTWEPGLVDLGLVLGQEPNFTVILVGEDIIHVSDDGLTWKVELIPLKPPSNIQGS